jgi:hypothetical protein
MPLQATSGAASYDAFGGGVAAVPQYIEDVFSTWLYTGDATARTITNGIDLSTKGGLVWLKARSTSGSNHLADTIRGGNKWIYSDLTQGQDTVPYITAFNTDGFSLNTSSAVNASGTTYASWTFRKQPKFFDVVTWTGNSTARTIAHNLGSVPGCIMVKAYGNMGSIGGSSDWQVYHQSIGNQSRLVLNATTEAINIGSACWNSTTPTDTVFSLGTNSNVNQNSVQYVAYLFAHNAGGFGLTGTDNVISCGSYVGSGVASPPKVVTLGYEPQWIMIKSTTNAYDWVITDTMRGMSQTSGTYLVPNTSAAEVVQNPTVTPTATGFELNNSHPYFNSNDTYIYIAIRRGPMKVPTTGTSVFQAALRTGTGATATVTGINFPPDLAILGNRTIVNTRNFWDKLRGVGRYLGPNTVGAEENNATTLTAFNMNGISLGNDTSNSANYNGSDFVNYYFRRAPNFFDEVCYTGSGASRTVTHNLGVVPELIIVKSRNDSYLWAVYSAATGNTVYLALNSTATPQTVNWWNNTTPTASVFSVFASSPFNPNQQVNGSGIDYVAYLFATCAGVSKVGSYTGNGSTQAIACGFAGGARFVLIKRTNATGDWYVYDTARGMTTLTDPYLLFNNAVAETPTLGSVTTTTGGFTVDASVLAAINTNAASYVFFAVA